LELWLTTISVTLGSPRVRVPVLSSTIAVSLCARSSASLLLNRMPFSAPLPMPTMIAVGVARPIAQGQAITSTAIMRTSEGVNSPVTPIQMPKVTSAIVTTIGTKIADTRSASRWIGAMLPWPAPPGG